MMEAVYTVAETITRHLWSVSWQVSILIGIIWIIDRLSVRASSLFRYWLWCTVLVRLCIPVSLELPTGIVPSFGATDYMKVPSPRNLPILRTLTDTVKPPDVFPMHEEPAGVIEEPSWEVHALSIEPLQFLFFGWLATVTVIALALLAHVLVIRRRLKRCKPVGNPTLIALVERLAGTMELSQPVRLLYLDPSIGDVPATTGIMRPCIFLPPRLVDNWSLEELEPILLHELAHIRRRDLPVNWLQILVQTAFFFHPLVWYANRRIRLLREEVCDDIAVSLTGDNRRRYTLGMLRVVEQALHEPSLGFMGIGLTERKSTLRARITRILSASYRLTTRLSALSVVLLLVIGIAGISVACRKPAVVKAGRESETLQRKIDYEKYILIELNGKGNILVDGVSTHEDSLLTVVEKKYDESGVNKDSRRKFLLFRTDVNVRHGDMLRVIKLLRSVGTKQAHINIMNPATKQLEMAEISHGDSIWLPDDFKIYYQRQRAEDISKKRGSIIRLTTRVIENSLRVVLNGDTLISGKDYTFDPARQEITLLDPQAQSPTADLVIKYEEAYKKDTPYIGVGWGEKLKPPDELKRSFIEIVDAVNRYACVGAKVDTHVYLDSEKIFDLPVIIITADKMFSLQPSETKNLENYLRSGGFAFIDNATPQYEYGEAEASLRQMLREVLGKDAKFLPIPNDFPLYRCHFIFDDGAPSGAEHLLSRKTGEEGKAGETSVSTVPYLEGIWLDGRLAAIYSDRGYLHRWKDPVSSELQIKFGVNVIVFALLQEGGIYQQRSVKKVDERERKENTDKESLGKDTIEELLEKARSLHKRKEYGEAIMIYKEIANKKYPDGPQIVVSHSVQDTSAIESNYSQAIQTYLGLYNSSQDPIEKLVFLRSLIQLSSQADNYTDIEKFSKMMLASDYTEGKKPEGANFFYKEEAYYYLATNAEKQGNNKQAIEYLLEGFKQFPNSYFSSDMLLKVGVLYLTKLNKEPDALDLAAENFEKYIKTFPNTDNTEMAHYYLGFCYYNGRRFDEAYRTFKEFTDKYPNSEFSPEAYFYYSDSNYNLGNLEECIKGFDIVITKYPKHDRAIESLYTKAWALLDLGRNEEAMGCLRLIVEKYPESRFAPSALFSIGDWYAHTKNTELAIKYYEKVIEKYPLSELAEKAKRALQDIREGRDNVKFHRLNPDRF